MNANAVKNVLWACIGVTFVLAFWTVLAISFRGYV